MGADATIRTRCAGAGVLGGTFGSGEPGAGLLAERRHVVRPSESCTAATELHGRGGTAPAYELLHPALRLVERAARPVRLGGHEHDRLRVLDEHRDLAGRRRHVGGDVRDRRFDRLAASPELTFEYEPTSRYSTFAACIAVCSSMPRGRRSSRRRPRRRACGSRSGRRRASRPHEADDHEERRRRRRSSRASCRASTPGLADGATGPRRGLAAGGSSSSAAGGGARRGRARRGRAESSAAAEVVGRRRRSCRRGPGPGGGGGRTGAGRAWGAAAAEPRRAGAVARGHDRRLGADHRAAPPAGVPGLGHEVRATRTPDHRWIIGRRR